MRQWVRYLLGRILPPRYVEYNQQIKFGAVREQRLVKTLAVIPPPNKPGYIGAFPVD